MKKLTCITCSLLLIVIFSLGTIAQNYLKLSDFPEEIKNSKPFKRFEWMYNQRAFPFDIIPSMKANKNMTEEIKRIKQKGNKSQLEWFPKGPVGVLDMVTDWGISTGRVRAIAVHPADPLTVYIGAASGGIWKTTDGGDTWMDIGKTLESLTFGAIAIDPNNPETVYAGSGEVGYFLDQNPGWGLFKSTDGGDTWNWDNESFGERTHFSNVIVSPNNSNILFASLAAGTLNLVPHLENEGIWKSTDAGEFWVKKLDVPYGSDVKFHPNDPNILYACIGGSHEESGFYISSDLGETWQSSSTGLQEPNTIHRMHIDISMTDPQIIYAVIYDIISGAAGTTTAFKSINGGANWEQISEGVHLGGINAYGSMVDQGFYDLSIVVDPTNPDHVFIGNVELHEANDGENFSYYRPNAPPYTAWGGLTHNDHHKLVYAPSNPNYFYLGSDGGIYQSTDGLVTAESKGDGLETLQFDRMASHPTNPDIMIGGTQDNGIIITYDGGNSWTQVEKGDGTECFFDHTYPDSIVYASWYHGRLLKSTNGGLSFNSFFNINGAWITPFIQHPNGDTLYAASKHIYRYTGTWQPIAFNVSPELINTMAQCKVNPQNMIFAAVGNIIGVPIPDTIFLVKVSTDGGYNWTDVTDNIPGETTWISRVVTDPMDENTMYVVRSGYSEGNKIYKTTNLGETWINLSGDLPNITCNDLFIDPENTDHYYVATDLGVYFSENEGLTWTYAGDGLPFVVVRDFDYVEIENIRYLRIATHGRSIYETILPNSCLPEGEVFETQEQIDNFQTNYPGCTEIEGDVEIEGDDISNLNGLSVLVSIGGHLDINNNPTLTSLTGLENLTSIGGKLDIVWNGTLESLTGLENLSSIEGDLQIHHNPALTSLTGLENLSSIEGSMNIGYIFWDPWPGFHGNPLLTNLNGLNNFTYLNGDLIIVGNGSLTSLAGLEGLTSIGASISVIHNNSLASLAGLENLTSIVGNLNIGMSEGGWSSGNASLPNLTGLEGLTSIGGSLGIYSNGSLTTLTGLENLTSIGGDISIGSWDSGYGGNASLLNLTGLESLTSIGGALSIVGNDTLPSLTGLENIDEASITDLTITNNNELYDCDVWSICQYLNEPGGTVLIEYNAPECNSIEEVQEHCLTEVEEIAKTNGLRIIPNPFGSSSIITYTLNESSHVTLKILDLSGRLVVSLANEVQQQGEQRIGFNSDEIKPGIYFCVLETIAGIQTKKMIKL